MAVLLALARGPSSGVGLMGRLRERAFGTRPLGPGTLYPLLRRLETAGLARSWLEVERSRVGRPRRFQELTARGVTTLDRVRRQLRTFGGAVATPAPRPSALRQMRSNLRRAFRVSSFAMQLRKAERE